MNGGKEFRPDGGREGKHLLFFFGQSDNQSNYVTTVLLIFSEIKTEVHSTGLARVYTNKSK